jgi:hypothetical protein
MSGCFCDCRELVVGGQRVAVPSHHSCAYVAARNKLIPEAEKIANAKVRIAPAAEDDAARGKWDPGLRSRHGRAGPTAFERAEVIHVKLPVPTMARQVRGEARHYTSRQTTRPLILNNSHFSMSCDTDC